MNSTRGTNPLCNNFGLIFGSCCDTVVNLRRNVWCEEVFNAVRHLEGLAFLKEYTATVGEPMTET